jgi:hypothetical protein
MHINSTTDELHDFLKNHKPSKFTQDEVDLLKSPNNYLKNWIQSSKASKERNLQAWMVLLENSTKHLRKKWY